VEESPKLEEPSSRSARVAAKSASRKDTRSPLRRVLDGVREFVIIVIVALLVATLLKTFVAQMFIIPSQSMEDTLEINDRVVAMKIVKYERGDIIVFEDKMGWLPPAAPASPVQKVLEFVGVLPASGDQYLVKRLIGLPGDHVVCCSATGKIMVNGIELEESSYLYPNVDGTTVKPSEVAFDIVVPAGRVFVMGDHRNRSADSRYHLCDTSLGTKGLAAFPMITSIQGPVRATGFPFARARTFSVPETFKGIPAATSAPPPSPQITVANC
jgi:signal peptidase I